jgi:hypothetical protein
MRGSLGSLSLQAALKRGGVVAAANWPLIFIQFALVSAHRLAIAVPITGGVFVVALLAGADVRALTSLDLRAVGGLVAASLAGRPEMLVSFVVAVGVVAVGGGVAVFLAQAGTAHVLTVAERRSGPFHRGPFRWSAVSDAMVFEIPLYFEGIRRLGRRFLQLGAGLCVAYGVIATLTLGGWGMALTVRGTGSVVLEGAMLFLATAGALVGVGLVHLTYALLQVVMATDNCGILEAAGRLRAFVVHDARQVGGVFLLVLVLSVLASAASLLATAGLALIAWVPVVGLAVVPLQAAAWVLRGVVFHFVELGAWSAYQVHYRRHADPALEEPPVAWVVQS